MIREAKTRDELDESLENLKRTAEKAREFLAQVHATESSGTAVKQYILS